MKGSTKFCISTFVALILWLFASGNYDPALIGFLALMFQILITIFSFESVIDNKVKWWHLLSIVFLIPWIFIKTCDFITNKLIPWLDQNF